MRVNEVTVELFRRCRTAEDYLNLGEGELEALIRPTGFFNQKARSIRGCCMALVERFGGEVPRTTAELVTLPGVGRKTAAVVSGNAFGVREGIAVDTHVGRLSRRLRLDAPARSGEGRAGADEALPARALAAGVRRADLPRPPGVQVAEPQLCRCAVNDLCPSAFKLGPIARRKR